MVEKEVNTDKGFELLGDVKLWEGKSMGKLLEDKGCLVRFVCADSSWCQLSSWP